MERDFRELADAVDIILAGESRLLLKISYERRIEVGLQLF